MPQICRPGQPAVQQLGGSAAVPPRNPTDVPRMMRMMLDISTPYDMRVEHAPRAEHAGGDLREAADDTALIQQQYIQRSPRHAPGGGTCSSRRHALAAPACPSVQPRCTRSSDDVSAPGPSPTVLSTVSATSSACWLVGIGLLATASSADLGVGGWNARGEFPCIVFTHDGAMFKARTGRLKYGSFAGGHLPHPGGGLLPKGVWLSHWLMGAHRRLNRP